MQETWPVLALGAVAVGVAHTVLGPDHYLPFVAIGAARGWSRTKLLVVTALCGTAHIGTSFAIALVVGGLMGLGVSRVEEVFGWQGDVVAWSLVVLGLGYAAWGLLRPHRHRHMPDGSHLPEGISPGGTPRGSARDVTVWALVLIFAFGPCEAMIPLVMLPSAQGSVAGIVLVLGLFGTVTVLTMTALVAVLHAGVRLLPTDRLARAAHPLAGAVIALCGVAILVGL
jgi:nickel/cobalt transporter (NicO) family protein